MTGIGGGGGGGGGASALLGMAISMSTFKNSSCIYDVSFIS
jgi:hypothetical protein